MPKITTLLFDCDNTLVLSESLAFEACAELANEILASRGIADRYTGPQLLSEFVGQNFRGMITNLKAKYHYDMEDAELETYVTREEDQVIAKLKEKLRSCEGVDDVLPGLEGRYTLAVVSSSALRRVVASVEKVGQDKYFAQRVFSAASSLPKPTSKPDPAIYLWAMEKLGVKASECVAIEDSRSGTLSGVRAGIHVVGYVGSYEEHEKEKMRATLKESGADPIMEHWSEFEGVLKAIDSE